MKTQPTKKPIAFFITTIIFLCLTQFSLAQHCKPGYFLSCDSNGKRCKCFKFNPCPRTGCFLAKIDRPITNTGNEPGINQPSAVIELLNKGDGGTDNILKSGRENGYNKYHENFKNENNNPITRSVLIKNNSITNPVSSSKKNTVVCPPLLQTNFEGNPLTPFYLPPVGYYASECNIAISNAGKIVSISNGWLNYYNENGTKVFSDSLYHFGNSLIDVHVMYDPKKDRFVLISMYGVTNFSTTFQGVGIVAGFSKTNDPIDGWNFYFLPDTIFDDNSSGDYPLLGISDDEIFITESRSNMGGNSTHSSIVQIDKNDGYAGLAAIHSQIYHVQLPGGLKYGDLIPAQGGSSTYGPGMYFIMANETGHPSNVYRVYEITNTMASGQATLKMYGPVSSNLAFAPKQNAYQPGGIPLNSGDADKDDFIQNAFFENGLLQFCQHTNVNGKAAVYLGRIGGIPNNLTCTAKTVSDPNLYYSYPAIIYTGNSSSDNSAIVGCEHAGLNAYPGLSAIYVNSNFDVSPLITVKSGKDTINALWGDYSGICRRYNQPGEVWFEGQYGSPVFKNINWIAKLQKPPACSPGITADHLKLNDSSPSLTIGLNPFTSSTEISFTLPQAQKVSIIIYDVNGRLIKTLINSGMQPGTQHLIWNAKNEKGNEVPAGIYFLKMKAGYYTETKKIVFEK
jgi:hypothetical protein